MFETMASFISVEHANGAMFDPVRAELGLGADAAQGSA
jgi:hypothetical protein